VARHLSLPPTRGAGGYLAGPALASADSASTRTVWATSDGKPGHFVALRPLGKARSFCRAPGKSPVILSRLLVWQRSKSPVSESRLSPVSESRFWAKSPVSESRLMNLLNGPSDTRAQARAISHLSAARSWPHSPTARRPSRTAPTPRPVTSRSELHRGGGDPEKAAPTAVVSWSSVASSAATSCCACGRRARRWR
jgi:hypothetical protein